MTKSKIFTGIYYTCKMCGIRTKAIARHHSICNNCHKIIHTRMPKKNYFHQYYENWYKFKRFPLHDEDRYSRVIEKYKPKISGIIYDSMKDFKQGQLVKYVKIVKFRKFPNDQSILNGFLNKTGEILRIGKMMMEGDIVFPHKFIEVRFISPNMKKKDILCVRRELTDASEEEKKQYMKVKEQFEAMEVAKKI